MSATRRSNLRNWLLKAFAVAGSAGLALAALLSGTDRQSREFPNAPSVVGWPYDTGAARAKAALAFVRSGPASAIDFARRAVMSDPLSAQAVSMLGRAQLYSERYTEAHKAFEVSGQLGWRDVMTQIYWLDQALQESNYTVAAERLDALLRQSPDIENRDELLSVVAATPEGRIALAERLKLSPRWARGLVTLVNDIPVEQLLQRSDLMRRTGKGVWDCSASQAISQKFISIGMLDEAQSAWRLNCLSSNSLVYDGGFEEVDTLAVTTAFDWQLYNRGDAYIALTQDARGNHSLALEVNAARSLAIIRQLVVLKPGRYRLGWRTPETSANQARAVRVSLTCQPDLGRAMEGTAVPGKPDSWTNDFAIGAECPAWVLVFWLAPKSSVQLDDVTLEPL